jgi:endo-1,4-beta-xylanase
MRSKAVIVARGLLGLVFVLFTTPAVQAQLAAGQSKFLGNILSTSRTDENFATYWNQVTPEDNGKLGYVEATQSPRKWSVLDAMYEYAQEHGFPFKEHTFVWGRQQPEWMKTLSAGDQRMEIRS